MFYVLSIITGILECGWIAYGVVHSLPIWQILCYPLFYHIGNLFPKPFSLSRKCLAILCAISVFADSLMFVWHFSNNTTFELTCISLFLISAAIQSVRSELNNDGNRLMKRIFRVSGFSLAPLAVVIPSVILVISSVIALYALKNYNGRYHIGRLTGQNGFSTVMIFHQLHYFFYAHITLTFVSIWLVHEYFAMGAALGALLFCGTWITYMSIEPIVSRLTAKLLHVFYAGHIAISLLLFVMSFVIDINKPLFILFWILTGFGGGVVYTISAKAKAVGSYNKDSMTISENAAHTFGLMSAVCVAAVSGIYSLHIALVFGSLNAILAVISMIFSSRKENSHEIIAN